MILLALLAALQAAVKADNVTVPLTDPSINCSWNQPGGSCWSSALPAATQTIAWQWADFFCKTHAVGLNNSLQTMALTFTGIQAWISLYPDGYGSNGQISVDDKIVANVSTVSGGTSWYDTCNPTMGWTGYLPYGQHTVKLVKNINTQNTWVYVGSFVYDNSQVIPSSTTSVPSSSSTSPGSSTISVPSSSSTSPGGSSTNSAPKSKGVDGGAIGGAIAGVLVLLLALLSFFLWRRRRYSRLRSEIDLDDGSPTSVSDYDAQPQPYIALSDFSQASQHEGIPVMAVPFAGDRKAPSRPPASTTSTSTSTSRPPMVEADSLPPDMLQALAERNAELTATIRLMRENPDAVPPSLFPSNAEAPPSYDPHRGRQQP